MRTTFGSEALRRSHSHGRRRRRRAAQGGGGHRARQDQYAGVCLRAQHRERRVRGHAQSVESRPERGRLERRIGGCARHGHMPHRSGHRSRRLRCAVRPRCAAWSASGPRPGLIPAIPKCSPGIRIRWKGPWRAPSAMPRSCLGHGRPCRRAIAHELQHRHEAVPGRGEAALRQGARIAWSPDLGGLVTVDPEIASACEASAGMFRKLGARVERASADMHDVPDIVALTPRLLMVARHADKVERWRDQLQAGLVENTSQGLGLTSRDVARGELLRTQLWNRVRAFFETRDLWLTPTAAVPPFPIELPHAMEIGGKPAGKTLQRSYLTYAFSLLGLPASLGSLRLSPATGCPSGSRSSDHRDTKQRCCGPPQPSRRRSPGPIAFRRSSCRPCSGISCRPSSTPSPTWATSSTRHAPLNAIAVIDCLDWERLREYSYGELDRLADPLRARPARPRPAAGRRRGHPRGQPRGVSHRIPGHDAGRPRRPSP